jgi:dTDP-4-dehydrorhamnose 3,5-epimerase
MIEGVWVQPLKQIRDDRGGILHMLRNDSELFEAFGEIYFSIVNPGSIKGWNLHKRATANLAVPSGQIKLVLYDERPGSGSRGEIQEITVGEEAYALVKISPGIWTSFKGLGTKPSIVANCCTLAHDPEEVLRCDPFASEIPYRWRNDDEREPTHG